jgi:hypothetical protein
MVPIADAPTARLPKVYLPELIICTPMLAPLNILEG